MCTGNPTELLARAMEASKLTPEQRQKFENDFAHFCNYSGLVKRDHPVANAVDGYAESWAKWAYWCGQRL